MESNERIGLLVRDLEIGFNARMALCSRNVVDFFEEVILYAYGYNKKAKLGEIIFNVFLEVDPLKAKQIADTPGNCSEDDTKIDDFVRIVFPAQYPLYEDQKWEWLRRMRDQQLSENKKFKSELSEQYEIN